MKMEFLAIGSEMLSMQHTETNSILLQEALFQVGFTLLRKMVIIDDQDEITTAIENAAKRSDILVCSGGLGPTVDDLTVESAAHAARKEVVFSPDVWERIESGLKTRNRPINEGHRKQARVIEGAEIFINKTGQAPAQYLQIGQLHVFLLPGVPGEFKAFLDEITARIITIFGGSGTRSRNVFKLAAVAEGDMDIRLKEKLGHILPGKNEELIITTKPGVQTITLISTSAPSESRRAEIERALKDEFSENLFAANETTLEEAVAKILTDKSLCVSVAESCTGGMLANKLTDVPGSSLYFHSGLVTYSNEAKQNLLGVSPQTLIDHGAVSAQTAKEMAEGLLKSAKTDITVSITGIAGPSGGTTDKPVGTVFIGIADKAGAEVKEFHVSGIRSFFKEWVSSIALNILRLRALRYH